MIKANFNAYNTYITDSLYQWDINQDLIIYGLKLNIEYGTPEIHFSNRNTDRAIVGQSIMTNNIVKARIPNSLLQEPYTIYAHIGVYEGDTFKVVEKVEIPVIPKARPMDYQIQDTDEEIYSFNALENAVNNAVNVFQTTAENLSNKVDNGCVEVGIKDEWHYIKFPNGELECTREYSETLSKTLDFGGFAGYCVEVPLPTNLFIDEPYYVCHTVQIGTALTIVGMAEPWSTMVKLWALSVDGTHETKWRVTVKGKWK